MGLLERGAQAEEYDDALKSGVDYNIVMTWLLAEVVKARDANILRSAPNPLTNKIALARGSMSDLHDRYMVVQPNSWASLMKLMVDMLVFLYVVGTPFTAFVYEIGCIQIYVLVFTFFLSLPFTCTSGVITILNDPFGQMASYDTVDVGAVLGETDRVTFNSLRSAFSVLAATDDDDGAPNSEEAIAVPGAALLKVNDVSVAEHKSASAAAAVRPI